MKVRSNYGLGIPWTAQSDQAWLQVTSSGTGGGNVTLTANPTGLAAGLYIATVTVASSDASVVNTEHIRIGLWVASAAPSGNTSFAGTEQFNAVVADPIRPYVYAHETNSTSVRVFNVYTGTELAPITGLPATTVSLTVSNDGGTLFALGSSYLSFTPSSGNVIATANLNTGVAGGTLSVPGSPNNSFPLNFIHYVRTDGREFVMDGSGRTFRATDGSQAGTGGFGYSGVTTDGSAMFQESGRYPLDYTDAGGGVFSISSNPTFASLPVASNIVGDVTNVDGSRACGPYQNGLNCFNGDMTTLFALTGVGTWTNNTAMGCDGRLYFGTSIGLPGNDVFVYSAGGVLVTSFKSNLYGLGDRTMVVSSDGFVLAMATPFGQPPTLIIVPIGP